jgi:putative Ca2+/H+ antiporter (TMEM165/GDT1 family)
MNPSTMLSAFVLLFLAEMGDKTQLMAMTLAHRYRVAPVIGGVLLAFLVLNTLAVLLGEALFRYVPQRAVLLAAAALFLFFAYRSWRDSKGEEAQAQPVGAYGALASSFALIFVAELGDKTQLALIALAAGTGEPWSVFIGGTLALWAVSLIGILLGSTVLRRIPKAWMHRAAAVLFLAFGVLAAGEGLLGRTESLGGWATANRASEPASLESPASPTASAP